MSRIFTNCLLFLVYGCPMTRDPLTDLVDQSGLAAAVAAMSNGVVLVDCARPALPITFVNPGFERLTGYRAVEVIGRNCRFLQGPETDPNAVAAIRAAIAAGEGITTRLLNYRKDGTPFWNELILSPIVDQTGTPGRYVGIQNDVTAEVSAQEDVARKVRQLDAMHQSLRAANADLERLAYYDALTGLPTRRLFHDRATHALAHAKRTGTMLAFLFVDLDGFKQVNDQLGHAVGDEVLQQVADRLHGALRDSDTLARLGGDEYILLLDTGVSPQSVVQVCRRLSDALAPPFEVAGRAVQLGLSIGTSLYPDDGGDLNTLMRAADAAMYKAKFGKKPGPSQHRDWARVQAG